MEGLGTRLRQRARELGLSDAEVARRVGVAATRYGNYAGDRHEPDLATFARICAVLGVSPTTLLGMDPPTTNPASSLRAGVLACLEALDEENLRVLAVVADGLVARAGREALAGTAPGPPPGRGRPAAPARTRRRPSPPSA